MFGATEVSLSCGLGIKASGSPPKFEITPANESCHDGAANTLWFLFRSYKFFYDSMKRQQVGNSLLSCGNLSLCSTIEPCLVY